MNIRGSVYVPNNTAYMVNEYVVVPLYGLDAWLKMIDESIFQTSKAKKLNTGVGLITFCHFSKVGSDYVAIKEKTASYAFKIRSEFFGLNRA